MINKSTQRTLELVTRDAQRTSVLSAINVLVFCIFFQGGKQISLLRAVNPFLEDPYDAVGSIAVQIAFVVALLNLIRAFGYQRDQTISPPQLRFIIRGNVVALAVVAIALLTDLLAEFQQAALWPTSIGAIIFNSILWGIILLTLVAGLKLAGMVRNISTAGLFDANVLNTAAQSLAAEDIFLEFLAFIRVIAAKLLRRYPWLTPLLRWLHGETLTTAVRSAGAYFWAHSWRICLVLALIAGVALALIQVVGEGIVVDLSKAVMVTLVFIGIEAAIVVTSYAILGGFLGLHRPAADVRPRSTAKDRGQHF